MATTLTFNNNHNNTSSDRSIADVDMLFLFPDIFSCGPFATINREEEEAEEYSFLTRGVLQHRTLAIPIDNSMMMMTTTEVSELSVDYLEYERMQDWWTLRPITQRSRVFDPRICTIRVSNTTNHFSIEIANNGNVEFHDCAPVLEFCAALTEYDSSWIFHIRPSGNSTMAIVVTSSIVDETLRCLFLTAVEGS